MCLLELTNVSINTLIVTFTLKNPIDKKMAASQQLLYKSYILLFFENLNPLNNSMFT